MSVTLENVTSRPLWLVLESGESLRLAPGERSAALADVEVGEKVKALAARGAIKTTASRPRGRTT
jgi:hypothetical protein